MSDTKKSSTISQLAATLLSLAVLACLALPAPADAAIRFEYDAQAQPLDLEEPFERKAPTPRYQFMVPHYVVDTSSASGMTTLFSVRNSSADSHTVEIAYFDERGLLVQGTEVLLDGKETVTVNLRNIEDLVAGDDGVARGFVLISLLDGPAGSIEPTNILTGDFFYVDPAENFASGGVLSDALSSNCTRWHSRYFAGGPFAGGTDFLYLLPNGPNLEGVVAEGNVYDEAGVFMGTVTITSDGERTGVASTGDSPDLPPFGTVEWRFSNDNMGTMMAIFSAEGRYSVGTRSFCAD